MKLKIHQPKLSNKHQSSFWYDGLIAEYKDYSLRAVGEIAIVDKNGELVHDGTKERGNGIEIENDHDLYCLDEENCAYESNNWYQVYNAEEEIDLDTDTYDEAIRQLKIIADEN